MLSKIKSHWKRKYIIGIMRRQATHSERKYLVHFLRYVGYADNDIAAIIKHYNRWDDYDERITAAQIELLITDLSPGEKKGEEKKGEGKEKKAKEEEEGAGIVRLFNELIRDLDEVRFGWEYRSLWFESAEKLRRRNKTLGNRILQVAKWYEKASCAEIDAFKDYGICPYDIKNYKKNH